MSRPSHLGEHQSEFGILSPTSNAVPCRCRLITRAWVHARNSLIACVEGMKKAMVVLGHTMLPDGSVKLPEATVLGDQRTCSSIVVGQCRLLRSENVYRSSNGLSRTRLQLKLLP